ncbi:transposase [Legionella sp. CNM-1927-20]|uniref:transposase n=1 Tax=Legionella sp. CNM-1927-20 TaxID=3422221 RepID=UPI00403ADE01
MSYKHLNFAQCCKISAFWKVGYLQKDIAREIGVSPSTISRELKRNRRWNYVYCPDQAASSYKLRRKNSRKPKKFTEATWDFIKEKLQIEWSPEQISGYERRHGLFEISHERIYQYIWLTKLLVVNCIYIYDVVKKDIVSDTGVLKGLTQSKTEYLLIIDLRLLIKNHA